MEVLHRSCVYRWLNSDPEFASAFDAVRENIVDELEASVIDRAQKSDLLAMFVMKRFRPAYRDRLNIDIESVDAEIRELMSKLNLDPHKLLASFASKEPDPDYLSANCWRRRIPTRASQLTKNEIDAS